MENFPDALNYAALAFDSAGTAEEKFGAYLDSVEAATNNLKATWEGFARDFASSDVIKGAINTLTSLIKVLDSGFGKLIITGTAVVAMLKLMAAGYLKLTAINMGSWLASARDGFVLLHTVGLRATSSQYLLADSSNTVTAALTSQEQATMAAKGATAALNIYILAAAAAIALVSSAIRAEQQEREKLNQRIKENNQSIAQESEQLRELVKQYRDLKSQEGTDTSARERLKNIQEQITELVEDEKNELDLVNGKLEEQLQLVDKIYTQHLQKSIGFLKTDAKLAIENLGETIEDTFLENFGSRLEAAIKTLYGSSWGEVGKTLGLAIAGGLVVPVAGAIAAVMAPQGGGGILRQEGIQGYAVWAQQLAEQSKDFEHNIDKAIFIHEKIGEKMEDLTDKISEIEEKAREGRRDLSSGEETTVGIYKAEIKNLQEEADTLNGQIESTKEALQALAQYDVTKALGQGKIIETKEEFEELKKALTKDKSEFESNYIIGLLNAALPQFNEGIATARDKALGFTESVKDLSSVYQTLTSAIEEYNSAGSFSLETLNTLTQLQPEYLDAIFNESGAIEDNTNAIWSKIEAQQRMAAQQAVLNYLDNLAAGGAEAVKRALGQEVDAINGVTNAYLAEAAAKIAAMDISEAEAQALLNKANNMLRQLSTVNSLTRSTNNNTSATKKNTSATNENAKAKEKARKAEERYSKTVSYVIKVIDKKTKALEKDKKTIEDQIKEQEKQNEIYQRAITYIVSAFEKEKSKIDKSIKKKQDLIDRNNEIIKSYEKSKKAIQNSIKSIEKQIKANEAAKKPYENIIKTIQGFIKVKEREIEQNNRAKWVYEDNIKQLEKSKKVQEKQIKVLEKKKKALEEEKQSLIDSNELIAKQNEKYDKALSYVNKFINSKIKELETERDAIKNKNEESQKEIELEKIKNNLQKARQKTMRVYREGQGWVWEQDPEQLQEAQKALTDFNVDKAVSAIEDLIKEWQEYLELWQEIPNTYDDYADEMAFKTSQNFVSLTDIQNQNTKGLEKFKKAYFENEKSITEFNTDNIDKRIEAIDTEIEKRQDIIEGINENIEANQEQIDNLTEKNDLLQRNIDLMNSNIQLQQDQIDKIDEVNESLQENIDIYNDSIDSYDVLIEKLQEANEGHEDEIDKLERKKDAWDDLIKEWEKIPDLYEEELNKKAFKSLSSGYTIKDIINDASALYDDYGFMRANLLYDELSGGLLEGQKNLDNLNTSLENVETNINDLQELSQEWSNLKDNIETSMNASVAAQLLGTNKENEILGLRLSNMKSFVTDYKKAIEEANKAELKTSTTTEGSTYSAPVINLGGAPSSVNSTGNLDKIQIFETAYKEGDFDNLNATQVASFLKLLGWSDTEAVKLGEAVADYLTAAPQSRNLESFYRSKYATVSDLGLTSLTLAQLSAEARANSHARGTKSSKSGLAILDEEGAELQIAPPERGRYEVLKYGTGILPHDLSEKIFNVATNPVGFIANALDKIIPIKSSESYSSKSGDTIIQISNLSLPSVENVDQFIKELQIISKNR